MSLSSERDTPPLAGASFFGIGIDVAFCGAAAPELVAVVAPDSPRKPLATPWAIAPVAAAALARGVIDPEVVRVCGMAGAVIAQDCAGAACA